MYTPGLEACAHLAASADAMHTVLPKGAVDTLDSHALMSTTNKCNSGLAVISPNVQHWVMPCSLFSEMQ